MAVAVNKYLWSEENTTKQEEQEIKSWSLDLFLRWVFKDINAVADEFKKSFNATSDKVVTKRKNNKPNLIKEHEETSQKI